MRFWLILTALLAFAPAPARAEVMVYELFTAKDCPSCPVADSIFSQISRNNPQIISLACHVTYFDRAGREDALSAPFCDGRQEGYKASRVVPKIFTPAVIVNGATAVKGNDRESVLTGLTNGSLESVTPIYLSQQQGYLNITLPPVSIAGKADVWLFAYDRNNAVRNLTKLLSWDGKSVSMAYPVTPTVPAYGYAVIAQTAKQTNIIAAGKTR